MDIESVIESKIFLYNIYCAYKKYLLNGSRSNKKVNYFHLFLKKEMEKIFQEKNGFKINLEQNIPSKNSSGRKRCDIVVNKDGKPYIVFPVKLVMTNFKQNKNNSWENLTGELSHIKWENPNLYIIPVNIYMDKTPYLKDDKTIKNIERIESRDIEQYKLLEEKNLAYDNILYIIHVEHESKIDEIFCKLPYLLSYNPKTKYRKLSEILKSLVS